MRAGVTWLEAQQHASTSCSAWPLVATQHTCGLRPRNSRRATRPRALPHDTSTQHGRRLRSPPTIRAVAAEVETAEAELLTTEGLGDQSDAGQLALLNLAATCSQLEQQLDALPALGPQQPSDSITVRPGVTPCQLHAGTDQARSVVKITAFCVVHPAMHCMLSV